MSGVLESVKGAERRSGPLSDGGRPGDALSKLSTAATRARKALDAQQEKKIDTAFRYLDLLFGGQFPAR
jgi:hypothetical protein